MPELGAKELVGAQEPALVAPPQERALVAPRLASSRVWLRAWEASDAPALEGVCGDPTICAYTTIPTTYTEGAALGWIERQRRVLHAGSSIVLAICPGAEAAPVGAVWLFAFSDGPPRNARLGAWMRREYRGFGLTSEAMRLLCGWAATELGTQELQFCFEPENPAARGLARNVGAQPVGWALGARDGTPTVLEHHTVPCAS
jgi:ribosomal-protein-alanine N-acetyltransferase